MGRKDLKRAIAYYTQLLHLKPAFNTSTTYIHMGTLYLKNKQEKDSFYFFKKGYETSLRPTATINHIYRIFKRENSLEKFLSFSRYLQENIKGKSRSDTGIDMVVATCWIDMEQPEFAKARLIKINASLPHPRPIIFWQK